MLSGALHLVFEILRIRSGWRKTGGRGSCRAERFCPPAGYRLTRRFALQGTRGLGWGQRLTRRFALHARRVHRWEPNHLPPILTCSPRTWYT